MLLPARGVHSICSISDRCSAASLEWQHVDRVYRGGSAPAVNLLLFDHAVQRCTGCSMVILQLVKLSRSLGGRQPRLDTGPSMQHGEWQLMQLIKLSSSLGRRQRRPDTGSSVQHGGFHTFGEGEGEGEGGRGRIE